MGDGGDHNLDIARDDEARGNHDGARAILRALKRATQRLVTPEETCNQ